MNAMQYTVLFRIECLHAYFGGGPCRSLTLAPTGDCARMMALYQMLFRATAGGGVVYYRKQSPEGSLPQFDESAPFTFALTSTDRTFANYTEVDLSHIDPTETVFHFDNRFDHAQDVSGHRQLLHEPGNPFAEAAVSVRAKLFSLNPHGTKGAKKFRVIEPLGDQVLVQGEIPSQGAPLSIDMRGFSEGLYLLKIDDAPPRRLYFCDQPAVGRWGVVSVYAGGVRQANRLPDNCRVIDGEGAVHPKVFALALESRKTIWRYYIIPSTDKQNFSQYELAGASKKPPGQKNGSETEFQFALMPETTSVDGRAAWVFESKNPLPFLLSPGGDFSLSLRPSKNGKAGQRTIRLPYAQPTSLAPKLSSVPGPMCSEIFVYI